MFIIMRVIQERDINTPAVSYTRGNDLSGTMEGAGGIRGLLARSDGYSGGNWTTHNYYFADGNGNVTYMLNSSQTMVASYRYDPFGNTISSSGTLASANVYRFSSKEIHVNSGMYYYGYRFYDPNLQRWMNRDPLAERGFREEVAYVLSAKRHVETELTLYTFVINDPLRRADRLGLGQGILGIPGTGGVCCNSSSQTNYWIDDGKWKPLPPGECTSWSSDCDGMTCAGGFYAVSDTGSFTCPKDPWNPKTSKCMDRTRWTPTKSGPDAVPPGPPYPGYPGEHRGGPVGNPPPGPGTW